MLLQGLKMTGGEAMGALISDLRFGLRTLLKNPGFAVVAILTLSLGVGANTAIFSFMDAILMRALPVWHPVQARALSPGAPVTRGAGP